MVWGFQGVPQLVPQVAEGEAPVSRTAVRVSAAVSPVCLVMLFSEHRKKLLTENDLFKLVINILVNLHPSTGILSKIASYPVQNQ